MEASNCSRNVVLVLTSEYEGREGGLADRVFHCVRRLAEMGVDMVVSVVWDYSSFKKAVANIQPAITFIDTTTKGNTR